MWQNLRHWLRKLQRRSRAHTWLSRATVLNGPCCILIDWLIHWSIDWLIDWLVDWCIRLIGRLIDWLIDEEKLVLSFDQYLLPSFSSMHIGSSQQTVEESLGNALEAIAFLKAKFPGGFENIRSLYLKLGGLSLPIYIDTGECHFFEFSSGMRIFFREKFVIFFFKKFVFWFVFLKKFVIGFVFFQEFII